MNDRLWTWPNALSFARLVGVPIFLWLVLVKEDWWAFGILVFAGLSDWLDGKLARMLDQTSKIGTLLDPAADRLYIFATLLGLVVRGIVPLWLARGAHRPRGLHGRAALRPAPGTATGPPPVHFVGKAATLCLLYAFPLLFLGVHTGTWATVAKVIGWAFTIWGTGLLLVGGGSTPPRSGGSCRSTTARAR